MRALFSKFLLLSILVTIHASAQAGLIVGTQPEGNGGYGVGFSFDPGVNLVIGQAITLNQAAVAGSITVYLNGDGTDNPQGDFMLKLMDAIGAAATSSNVLFSADGTFPAGNPDGHSPVTFSGLNLPLGANTYYLVVSSAAGPGTGWGNGADVLPGGVGTVGGSYVGIAFGGAVADYTYLDPTLVSPGNTNFRIEAVPEPGSLLLGAIALAGFLCLSRRSRR